VPKRDAVADIPPWEDLPRASPSEPEPRVVRHSAMADFRQCPFKWWLKWVKGWQPAGPSDASSLGVIWHHVMAAHYREIQRWQKRGETAPKDWLGAVSVIEGYKSTRFYETLQWMYEGYLDKHGSDDQWEVLAVELTQTVQMRPGLLYEWTSDILVRDHSITGSPLRVVDNKSSGNQLGKGEIDLSDQLGLYVKAQQLTTTDRITDGVWNQARTKKLVRAMTLDERYQRMTSYKPQVELDNIWADAVDVAEVMITREDQTKSPYSAPDPRVCSWKCDYKEEHLILRKTPREKWDRRLAPLMRTAGFRQGEVPRGSDVPT
jgi:hypothetical protein